MHASEEGPGLPLPGRTPAGWTGSVLLAPALVAALVYANTLWNGFVYDDTIVLGWLDTRRWDPLGFLGQTRGLTYAVHALDRLLWGEWPAGYHLTNVLLHVLATALAASAALALSRSRRCALLSGLIFAVHPVHVEAVANVANRKDLLAAIFALLALRLWIRPGRRWGRVGTTFACFSLGIYSKEVAIAMLPVMLLVADLLFGQGAADTGRRRLARSLGHLSPLVVAALVAALVFAGDLTALFQAESIAAKTDGAYHTYRESLATGIGNVPAFVRLLVFPLHLSVDYVLVPERDFGGHRVFAGFVVLAAWGLAVTLLWRRSPLVAFGLLWTIVMLLPCSNLVPLHHILVAERYLYLPSFGLCLVVGHLFDRALSRGPKRTTDLPGPVAGTWAASGLMALVLGAGALRSFLRNADWRDTPALVAAADRDGVDTWRIHKSAGSWAVRQENWPLAIRRYGRAVSLRPGDGELHFWLAVAFHNAGDHENAKGGYLAALGLDPANAKAHYNLAMILIQAGEIQEAIAHLRETTRLDPAYSMGHYNLAVALTLSDDLERAVEEFEETVRLEPDSAEAFLNLGAVQKKRGNLPQAIAAFREAARCNPADPVPLEELGDGLVAVGDYAGAIEAYRAEYALQNGNAGLLQKLAAAYWLVEDLEGAIVCTEAALKFEQDPELQTRLAAKLEELRRARLR